MTETRRDHWNTVYATKEITNVSWYETVPSTSLEMILATSVDKTDPIIDVGGGASFLTESLLNAGYGDLTVLDISAEVLRKLQERLGKQAASVSLLAQDVTHFTPTRKYAVWHDRAVFHFLVDPEDRKRYVSALSAALRQGGHTVIATFGPSGPERCSGLPIVRYDARTLGAEFGGDFQLIDSSLYTHKTPSGGEQQFIYCLFRRS